MFNATSVELTQIQETGRLARLNRWFMMCTPTEEDAMADRSAAAKKAARTKKRRTAGKKAAKTRKVRAASKKAALTRTRRAAARKAALTRKLKKEQSAFAPPSPQVPLPGAGDLQQ
jgi:hypothetical protein